MKVQIEISDVAFRKAASMLMLAAEEDEIDELESALRNVKASKDSIPLDVSLFGNQSERFQIAVLCVLIGKKIEL